MNNQTEHNVPQADISSTTPCGAAGAERRYAYEPQAYRNMSEAEQEAALMQIIQETADMVVKVKDDEHLHPLETCHHIGKLIDQAQRNAGCVLPCGDHGRALVMQVSWRCGICARTLQFYRKMAHVFEEEQLSRLVRVDIPWHEAREILNLIGHGPEPVRRLRLADVLRHLPDNPERGDRKEFSAWLKAMHAERKAAKLARAQQSGGAQPAAGDQLPMAS